MANSPTHPVLLKESHGVPPHLLPLPLYILSSSFHPRVFSVALAGLKLTLSLRTTLPPKCWGYRCGSPHPVYATLGGIQDFLILGQQLTQFNYSSTLPFKIAIIFSFCVCVHACGPACGDQRTTVGACLLLSPNVYQGPNLGYAVSIFIH